MLVVGVLRRVRLVLRLLDVVAQIVRAALRRVRERVEGLADPLKSERGAGLFVRVVLQRTKPIRSLQLRLGGVRADTEHRVEVHEFTFVEDVVHGRRRCRRRRRRHRGGLTVRAAALACLGPREPVDEVGPVPVETHDCHERIDRRAVQF